MASQQLQTQLSELYVAFFNRAPDATGFNYWLTQLDAGRMTMLEITSDWATKQAETALKYPASMTTSTFIDAIYMNVLGRNSDASGKAFWLYALDKGILQKDNFISAIIEAAHSNGSNDGIYLTNRGSVGLEFANSGNSNGIQAINILKIVNADAASVIVAKSLINGTATLNGTVMDGGYVNGATVFVDSNFDGILNNGEKSTLTNATGGYTLVGTIGQLVATGGIDITTNAPSKAIYTAIMGSTVISPISTLIAQKVFNGDSVASAETAVQSALGITGNINLNISNPLNTIASSTATNVEKMAALKIQAANVQINNIFSSAISAMHGAGETITDAKRASIILNATSTIIDSMATATATGVAFDISNASFIKSVLIGVSSEASSSAIASTMNANAQTIANVLAEYNTRIDLQVQIASAPTIGTALYQIGKIQEVVQDSLSTTLYSETTNIATINNSYGGVAGDNLLTYATIGTIDSRIVTPSVPIPVVPTPEAPPADTTAPVSTVTTTTIANTGDATVQSTETGTAYLVNTSVIVSNLASITGAADASWNQVTIATANTPTTLAATGLSSGTYKVYTTDASGNLSAASVGIVTIPSFTFTMAADPFAGGIGDDIFSGTYTDGGTGTFLGTADTVNGNGGTDTLSLTAGAVAITLADNNWTGITNVEKVVILSTGAGAQTLNTGALFDTAFTALGIDLTMTSTLGAININMSATPFTGAATITGHAIGAGAQTITTGSGAATVTATNDAGGAQTIKGIGLTTVNATIAGAGDQIIGDGGGNGVALVSVTATIGGAGSQTITSTSGSTVTIVANAAAGSQTITTAGGNDSITLTTATGQTTTISTGAGNDRIIASLGTDLITGGLGVDTMTGGGAADTFAFGTNGSIIGTSMDIITDFNTAAAADILTFNGATTVLLGVDATGLVAGSNVQQSAGGVITFHTTDNSLALKIIAIEADVELDAAGSIAIFVDGANTYVYYAGTATGNVDDQLIQLSGITSLTTISVGATTSIS